MRWEDEPDGQRRPKALRKILGDWSSSCSVVQGRDIRWRGGALHCSGTPLHTARTDCVTDVSFAGEGEFRI